MDEVLAVGDADFQKKCLGKMKDVSEHGRTVLFVSHNMVAVESLCQKAIYLEKGEIKKIATAKDVIDAYMKSGSRQSRLKFDAIAESTVGNDTIRIKSIEMLPSNLTRRENLIISFDLYNSYDINVFSTGAHISVEPDGGIGKAVCTIPAFLLNDDTYHLYAYFFTREMQPLFNQKDVFSFVVEDIARDSAYLGKISGVVRPQLNWETSTIPDNRTR